MSSARETPLDLWSRRRARVRAEQEELERASARAEAARRQRALADKPDEEILKELDLPDPDQLKEGDDIAAFMRAAVPERLRRRALRALWRANPVLANVDGLVDYGEDFAISDSVLDTVGTAYTVGRGFVSEAEASRPETAAATEADEGGPQMPDVAGDAPDAQPETEISSAADSAEPAPAPEADAAPPPPRRRMRFRFAADDSNAPDQANQMEQFE